MITTAQEILNKHTDRLDASNEANKLAVDKEQDFDKETTVYIFADGSKLKEDGVLMEIKAV